ncbi:phage virion morphogenesis protein [Megalodesulfovibrio gigas]|uniref:Phage virion morphogenesis protein n=1 Tax=Megalodesulfovibrio gigas (strain ATCC 19364 / DSM 1382 / NCIMB 9332 / VKM B-1759) TaxID=1121448 RepID=T2GD86_MEGG1|nr:phage virion morphogenesis protein [Megalodesulfovibrio gigas]AGW14124.1 hypothetical protein DGI_2372 [Megalodesulfovibrio gigas DSM 1382 = ATCC 19364]
MSVETVIVIDSHPVDALLRRLRDGLQDTAPAFKEVGQELVDISMEAFRRQADPANGDPWEPSGRAQAENGQTLIDTGRLRASITARSKHLEVSVGSNVVYAAIHQTGGRTKPHVIRPRYKKALWWPGAAGPRKKVNHPGSVVPPRPYLGVGAEDWDEISDILTHHLERA